MDSRSLPRRRPLALILVLYAVLGLSFALATPPFESSDEYKHFPVVQHLQQTGELPVLDDGKPGLWRQEAGQPPLYYAGMAALTSWIDTGDLPDVYRVNPHAYVGDPNQIKNKNLLIHDPVLEAFPWTGSVLAVYAIRFASIGLGLATIALTAGLASALFGPAVGLLAAALTAFNPMFLFISAAVNNDSLAALCGAAGLLLLVRLWREPERYRLHAALGVILGLGILTKLSLAGLALVAGATVLIQAWQRRSWRVLLVGGGLMAGIAAIISGWWFWRNWELYGDLTGLNAFIAVQGSRANPLTAADWLGEFGTFYRSFWGLFGGVNVAAPQWFYVVSNALAVLGLGALVWGLGRRRRVFWQNGTWIPVAWVAVLAILLIRWNLISPAFQGRLLFPGLAAVNALWAAGLTQLGKGRWHAGLAASAFFLIMAAALPWTTIRPAYAAPQPLQAVPAEAAFGPIDFTSPGGTIQLVGVDMAPDQSVAAGGLEPVTITLYWRAATPVAEDFVTAVHLLGQNLGSVGQVDRYPAWGMIPTSRWRPEDIWADPYAITVREGAAAPAALRVSVSAYALGEVPLVPMGPGGQALDLLLVGPRARLAPPAPAAEPETTSGVQFGDVMALSGYTLAEEPGGDVLRVTLFWEAVAAPAFDYTVFVHLRDASGEAVAFGDAPPLMGEYPTGLWEPGDRVVDAHFLGLPAGFDPGRWSVAVGLYDPVSGNRLERADGQGDEVSWPAE